MIADLASSVHDAFVVNVQNDGHVAAFPISGERKEWAGLR